MRFTSFASAICRSSARVSVIALAMLTSVSAFAQETRSTILGTVKDQSGAIGAAAESVTVTASTALLETTSGSGTASLEQRQISDLPVMSNSAILLARGAPGMQWTAQPNYLGMHSNAGGSAVSAVGGVGGNEFSLDGVSNSA